MIANWVKVLVGGAINIRGAGIYLFLMLVFAFGSQSGSPSVKADVDASSIGTTNVTSTHYLWGIIGDRLDNLRQQYDGGIHVRILRLSWRDYEPVEGVPSAAYIASTRAEIASIVAAGYQVIVDLGFHDTPSWLHANYANSYYVNQYGQVYSGNGEIDSGDANFVFNPQLKRLLERYVADTFATFGDAFYGVRLGGGRWGELTYPPAYWNNLNNSYWAFDQNAMAHSPVPYWHPGDPSPNHEADKFVNWYLDQLVDYQDWQVSMLRRYYSGNIMMLYPSWGIRPGQLDQAVANNLNGQSPAEINGEVQRGYDFARQIRALTDPSVMVVTTWLDADSSGDDTNDITRWSPVKYLHELAASNPLSLKMFGENTGQGDLSSMTHAASQMERYGLIGLAWYRERELLAGQYATLQDYSQTIRDYEADATTRSNGKFPNDGLSLVGDVDGNHVLNLTDFSLPEATFGNN